MPSDAGGAVRWPALLRAVVLGGAAALMVVMLLIPSEAAIADGAYAPLATGWCLLLVVWAGAVMLDEHPTLEVGWTEVVGTALIGWHSLSAVVAINRVDGRRAVSALWLVLAYGVAAFVLRQTLRTSKEARCLVAVMLWLATVLASLGLFQYGYGMPRLRREYERDPDAVLRASGISAEPGSAQREQFENRLRSVEPLATFALTNSLAGFLAPWLIASLALALLAAPAAGQRRSLAAFLALATILAATLVLTKSRTAFLAVGGGLALVGLYGRRGGWQLDWRIPAGLAAVGLVLGLVAVVAGGLDVQVLSEAPLSVKYRLEYWQATARVIAEHPLLGCGPGNFQQAYAAYKLPQASETVADPHNFLLEAWATAGTPGVLLLVALLGAVMFDLAALRRAGGRTAHDEPQGEIAPPEWIVFGGAACGLVAGPFVATLVGYPLETANQWFVWLGGGGLGAWALWFLASWIERGELSLAAAVIPQIVLLINLLAAGALVFPGVMLTICVLVPVALLVARQSPDAATGYPPLDTSRGTALPALFQPAKPVAGLIALAAVGLAGACLLTEYFPVLYGRFALEDARYRLEQRQYSEVEPQALAAARADRLSPEPWRFLAEVRLARWLAAGSEADWQSFVEAADRLGQLDPRNHVSSYARGNWYLEAWRKSGRPADLEQAIAAYAKASQLYPNRAMYHAQLAWMLHLAGKTDEARQAAERAIELDRQMPHKEQKLARQHVADPQHEGDSPRKFRPESAEQTAERLRSATAEQPP